MEDLHLLFHIGNVLIIWGVLMLTPLLGGVFEITCLSVAMITAGWIGIVAEKGFKRKT